MPRRTSRKLEERVIEAPSKLALDTDERVIKLEGQYEHLNSNLEDVRSDIQALGQRFTSFANDVNNALNRVGKPQWGVIISFAALAFSVFISSGGAGFTILKMSADHESELRSIASTYQDKVTESRFKEVETQFKGVVTEHETQIQNNLDRNTRTNLRLEHVARQVDEVDKQATKDAQWREDFNKYVWPQLDELIRNSKQ